MKKQAAPYFSWGNAKGSYTNTLNPISGVLGGGDRVPEWWMKLFDTTTDAGKLKAGIAFKSLACSLLAAGLVGGYRAIKHFNRVADMAEADNPAGKLRSQLSTTFEGRLEPKEASAALSKTAEKWDGKAVAMPAISWQNLFGMSIPLGASLLAASLAYSGVDHWAAARRNRKLDTAIQAKDRAVKSLMKTRARIAKGNISQQELDTTMDALNDDDLYIKEAKGGLQDRGPLEAGAQAGISTFGLLGALLLMASAVGSYKYFSEADPNNIKYKVSKRSLSDYARNKTGMTPVTVIPTDNQAFFSSIDAPGKATTKQRPPEIDTTSTGKPITVTL